MNRCRRRLRKWPEGCPLWRERERDWGKILLGFGKGNRHGRVCLCIRLCELTASLAA